MNRAEVIRRTLRAAELAAPHLPAGVGFSSTWRTNGRTGFNPRGHVNHTTEDPRPVAWSSLYRILRNGHGAISGNAICNSAIRQTARVVVIASGTAWHAGAGGTQGLRGNASVWGTEYQRGQGQTLTPDMLRAGVVWDWALAQAFGWPTRRIVEHFEWSPGRKPDRRVRNGVQIGAADWRRRVDRFTPTAPVDPDEEWFMALTSKQRRSLETAADALAGADARDIRGATEFARGLRSGGSQPFSAALAFLRKSRAKRDYTLPRTHRPLQQALTAAGVDVTDPDAIQAALEAALEIALADGGVNIDDDEDVESAVVEALTTRAG